jgi:hypothetical protein
MKSITKTQRIILSIVLAVALFAVGFTIGRMIPSVGRETVLTKAVTDASDGDDSSWRKITVSDKRLWSVMTYPEKVSYSLGFLSGHRFLANNLGIKVEKTNCGVVDAVAIADKVYGNPASGGIVMTRLLGDSFWYKEE